MQKGKVSDEFQRMKLRRLRELREFLSEKREVELEYLKAFFSTTKGWHKETIQGYLDDMEIMGEIEINSELIVKWKGGEEKNG